mgnify:CR=1 FL=1
MNRRTLLNTFGMGLGGLALNEMLCKEVQAVNGNGALQHVHHAPKAKRVIYLFQAGGPSQLDLFDNKPTLVKRTGQQLPESVRGGQRLTGMSGNQSSLPLVGSPFTFSQHGESGATLSELLPHTAAIADRLCFVKAMYTESINHGPGVCFMQSGSQIPGRPSIGAWLDYGLGSITSELPSVVDPGTCSDIEAFCTRCCPLCEKILDGSNMIVSLYRQIRRTCTRDMHTRRRAPFLLHRRDLYFVKNFLFKKLISPKLILTL